MSTNHLPLSTCLYLRKWLDQTTKPGDWVHLRTHCGTWFEQLICVSSKYHLEQYVRIPTFDDVLALAIELGKKKLKAQGRDTRYHELLTSSFLNGSEPSAKIVDGMDDVLWEGYADTPIDALVELIKKMEESE